MNDSDDRTNVSCPVCKTHNRDDAIGAQGMILTAAKALISGDSSTITAAATVSDRYAFHLAVTMYVDLLDQYGLLTGQTVDQMLDDMRGQLDEAISNSK